MMRSIHLPLSRATSTRTRYLAILAFLLLIPAMAAGCEAPAEHPTGSTEVVLRIDTSGGFVPVDYSLTQIPEFTLYGDGTVVVTGPMIEIYPQPALPNLQQMTISQDAIDKILSAARKAGLFTNGVDYGQPNVTDLPTTLITINAEGTSYSASIYALGFERMMDTFEDSGPTQSGLTQEQTESRSSVTEFIGQTTELDAFLSTTLDRQSYAFTSLAVYSLLRDPTQMYDETVPPNRLDWPLGDLSTLGEPVLPEGYRRLVVTGDELTQLQSLLGQATQITLWKSGDDEYYLYFRPLLPDENA